MYRYVKNAVLGFLLAMLGLGAVQEAEAQQRAGGKVLTMEDAVRIAIEQSEDLRDARFELEAANEQVSEAWGQLMPTIDANADYQRNLTVAETFLPARIFNPNAAPDELIPVRFGSDNVWGASVTLDQAIFKPGVFIGVGAASRFRGLQTEVLRGRTEAAVTRVRLAYYNLLLQQEQIRLTDKSLVRVGESLEETRALNRAGLSSDYDVLRLEVEYANLEPNLRRAQNAAAEARRDLAVELNLETAEGLAVAGSLAGIDLEEPSGNDAANLQILNFGSVGWGDATSAEGLIPEAMDGRSDLRQLGLTETLRHAEMRLEQAQYLPEISLFATLGVTTQQNGSPDFFGGQKTKTRLAGVRVSWPIFSGFSRDARIDQKRAVLRSAEAQTRLARTRATNEIRTLVDRLDEARLRARSQQLAVRQAGRGFEIASAQYREGLGSQLELTDAEVALRQSEFNYAQAVFDFLVAQAQLDQATGRVPYVDVNPVRNQGR